MTNFLIAAHVLAALLVLGPITVAASRFPRHVRAAADGENVGSSVAVAVELHRITKGYACASVAVPALGVGVASYEHLFSQRWVIASIGLTWVAAGLLAGRVVPTQSRALAIVSAGGGPAARAASVRAGAAAGMFGTVWVLIAILMVVQPGLGQ